MSDSLLVRTWNIAHGRDVPPGPAYGHARRKLLEEMVGLFASDDPDIVMLQEVPVWAGDLLRRRTGMGVTLAHTYGAHVPFVHVPLPLAAGEWLGKALPDVVKTQFEGQAQAVLYGSELMLVSARRVQVNARRHFRGEPRIAQLVRLRHRRTGGEFVVGNLHADAHDPDPQIEAGSWALEQFARGAPMVFGGDLNVRAGSPALRRLNARGWEERPADVGVDHVFVRGLELEGPVTRWPPKRRDLQLNGGRPLRLSDHSPVDAVVMLDA
jgi:endonuclease/exonuclease/phosphatase family metal-dependent hydrolase